MYRYIDTLHKHKYNINENNERIHKIKTNQPILYKVTQS